VDNKPLTATQVMDQIQKAKELLEAMEHGDQWTLIAPNGLVFRGSLEQLEQIMRELAERQCQAMIRQPVDFAADFKYNNRT